MKANKYALVTTCKNEADSIASWIADVNDQIRQPDEIVIVDAFSTDGTWESLTEWARSNRKVKLFQEKSSPARGRNLAIENCDSDIIVSTDMGCRLDKEWFDKLSKPFEEAPSLSVVSGNYAINMETVNTPIAWAAYYLLGSSLPNREVAYRKKTWAAYGKLPEDLTFAADDTVFSLLLFKSNLEIYYALDALVYWGRHAFWHEYIKENYGYGYGNGEAGLIPEIIKSDFSTRFPQITAIYYAITHLRPHLARKIFQSFLNGKIIAGFLIIPLHFVCCYYRFAGMVNGFLNGSLTCHSTRQRLQENSIFEL